MISFSDLVANLAAAYREQPRRFHVLAARFYLGKENADSLACYLNHRQVAAIQLNR